MAGVEEGKLSTYKLYVYIIYIKSATMWYTLTNVGLVNKWSDPRAHALEEISWHFGDVSCKTAKIKAVTTIFVGNK